MAQASSVQREPSMEEILASIRKIIEDGETHNKSATGYAAVPAAKPQESATVLDVESFRGTRGPEPVLTPGTVEEEEESFSAPLVELEKTADDRTMTSPAASPVSSEDVARNDDDYGLESQPYGEADWPLTNFASFLDEELRRTPTTMMDDNAISGRAAIISDKTQRQVAASFGELSDAFAASRQKSFDEMAAEMIRPMLQDWLDNNLPTLVERLVREEIERIARGPAA